MEATRNARLGKEMRMFTENPSWGITCTPRDPDVYDVLLVQMKALAGSPYEGGTFKLEINVPANYPFQSPDVRFVTPIRHPNIDRAGRICMDTLKTGKWLPSITLQNLLVAIQGLMANPNPDDPLEEEIAYEYRNNHELFMKNARRDTEKYAMT